MIQPTESDEDKLFSCGESLMSGAEPNAKSVCVAQCVAQCVCQCVCQSNTSSYFDERRGHDVENTLCERVSTQCYVADGHKRLKCKSKFVARPGVGTDGRLIDLISNHFRLLISDVFCYHYDVDIVPLRGTSCAPVYGSGDGRNFRKMAQRINRIVIEKLVQVWKEVFDGIHPVFDGTKNIYSAKPLKITNGDRLQSKTIEVEYEGNTCKYNVGIKFARQIDFNAIRAYYDGELFEFPRDAIQALDIILRHGPTMRQIPIGNSLYAPWEPNVRHKIGDNREVAFGHYQSVRPTEEGLTLVVDRTTTAFHAGGSVIDFVISLIDMNRGNYNRGSYSKSSQRTTAQQLENYCLTKADYDNISRELKGLLVFSSHLGYKRKYKIVSVSSRSADRELFDFTKFLPNGQSIDMGKISVAKYFSKQYKIDLKYGHLPCLNVGTGKRAVYLPMEVCHLVPDQHVKKKITAAQTASMIKLSGSQTPSQRFQLIEKSVKDVIDDSKKHLDEFKIQLSDKPLGVKGRVLDAPRLEFNGDSIMKPKDGKWDMKGKRFFQSVDLDNWYFVVLAYQMLENGENLRLKQQAKECLQKFLQDLRREGEKVGINIKIPVKTWIRRYSPGIVNGIIVGAKQESKNKGFGAPQMIMFLSNENDQMYNEIKYCGDVLHGITTQCIHQKNIYKYNNSLLSNFLLKINAKLGGINSKIDAHISRYVPDILKGSTMIIAADVTHPAPADLLTASVSAIVASHDVNHCYYSASIRVQKNSKEEMIMEFDEMLLELLSVYERKNNNLPDHIIFYRDGVSEGQFKSVLAHEHKKMLEAFQRKNNSYKPKVTFVIVQKRHHTRFMTKNPNDGVGRANNIPPGTTVDTVLTHPTDFDFYLCSHEGPQGTSRSTHYVVLHDDNKFTADGLQKLTYYLCHTYARCTRTISIPAPVMYAHLAAYRSRHHIIAFNDCDGQQGKRHHERDFANSDLLKHLYENIEVNLEHRNRLYYC